MPKFASSSSLHESQCVDVLSGFKFKPSDEELVDNYLIPKNKSPSTKFYIEEVDVHGIGPWKLNLGPKMGYCFVRTRKSSTGKGICRNSVKGYHWKNATGKKLICNGKASKTTLRLEAKAGPLEEFQKGWVINEYRREESNVESDWVLWRVENKMKKSKSSVTRQPKPNVIEDHQLMRNEFKDLLMADEEYVAQNHHAARLEEIYKDLASCILDYTPIGPSAKLEEIYKELASCIPDYTPIGPYI